MTNPFTEFMGSVIRDVAEVTAEWKRKPLREQFPEASDEVLDHIIKLKDELSTAAFRERCLLVDCDELREKLDRYNSDLTLEEIGRRKAMAELQLVELKIANLEADL